MDEKYLKENFSDQIQRLQLKIDFYDNRLKKGLFAWVIRVTLAIIVFILFWKEYETWLKWGLAIYFAFYLLEYAYVYFERKKLKNRMKSIKNKIE